MKNDWENRVQSLAKSMPYPPTPDIAARLRRGRRRVHVRQLLQAAAALLVAALALLAVPEIRAGVLNFFRIGAVEVVVTTATPPARFAPGGQLPDSVLDFPGATTLDDAQAHFGYPIPLPPSLGAPDRVYLINAVRPIVVLAWLDADGAVETSLHLMPQGTYALKMYEGDLEHTRVNRREAIWLPNPHYYLLQVGRERFEMRQVVAHALVWEADYVTYRLETNGTLDEALALAESIGNG